MRENTNTRVEEFDLMVASALSEAEVKAPRRVRRAVLSAVAPKVAPSVGWGWAAMAFTCVAAAVLLLRTPGEKQIPSEPGVELLANRQPLSDMREMLLAVSAPELSIPAAPEGFRPSAAPSGVGQCTVAEESRSTDPKTDSDDVQNAVLSDAGFAEDNAAGEETSRFVPLDLWADTEPEDFGAREKSASRLSLVAGGSAASQESRFGAKYDSPMYASGYTAAGVQEDTKSNFGIPVTANAGVRYHLTERMSIGAGLSWTMLSREFDGKYKTSEGRFTNTLQYVGIPVSLYYDVIQSRSTLFYVFGSVMAEKCFSNCYFLRSESSSPLVKESVNGLQYGLAAGLGVGFRLTDGLWLCLDPGINWWFDNAQPKSVRTENPFSVNFSIGFKLDL